MSICIMEEKSFCKECINKIIFIFSVKLFNDTQNIVRDGSIKKNKTNAENKEEKKKIFRMIFILKLKFLPLEVKKLR